MIAKFLAALPTGPLKSGPGSAMGKKKGDVTKTKVLTHETMALRTEEFCMKELKRQLEACAV